MGWLLFLFLCPNPIYLFRLFLGINICMHVLFETPHTHTNACVQCISLDKLGVNYTTQETTSLKVICIYIAHQSILYSPLLLLWNYVYVVRTVSIKSAFEANCNCTLWYHCPEALCCLSSWYLYFMICITAILYLYRPSITSPLAPPPNPGHQHFLLSFISP